MTGVGLCLPQLGPHVTVEVVAEFARRADELGYSGLWVQDHFMYPLAPERGYGTKDVLPPDQYKSVWAPTETLAFVAGVTENVALGTSILVAGNHWPVPLAQRLATIDQMSRGRLIVGLGVGWSPEEHVAAGTDVTERGRRMDDFVPTLLACWGPDPVSHQSDFFSVPESCVNPKPFGGRRPKLLSGMWSAQGLERTARWFDAWNPAGLPVGKVQKMVAAMNAKRPAGSADIEVYSKSFVQAPNGPAPSDGDNMAALVADAVAVREAGFADLCLEHNFWSGIQSADDWLAIPDRFLPVLEAARG
jgi:probable F420-dependent oxidoreductase